MRGLRAGDPRRIGPYRVVGRLGAGGMGTVFAGRSAGGRLVAVKVIRGELADDPDFLVRFSREVAAARSVSGLFTAPVVDADLDGPSPWLATAYVAGPSLAEAVRACGPLPVSSVLALAAGLAEGLAAIHRAGLVHRDLKPANVLLAGDGPRVIDFGISRAAEATALTHADLVIGSPGFMSPEQAEGRPTGSASDVFSLGAVLAFAATGAGPFGTGSAAALVYRVVHDAPALDDVPAEVRPLIGRCLAKDPGQRPATADLLAELDGTDLTAGWLPASFTAEFAQRTVPLDPGDPGTGSAGAGETAGPGATMSARLSAAPAFPEGGPSTMTTARPAGGPRGSAAPGGQAPPAGPPPGAGRRRRPVLLLTAAALAVAAVIGTAVALATSNPAGHLAAGQRPGTSPASPATAAPSRTAVATSGAPSPVSTTPPAAPTSVTATALDPYTVRVTWADQGDGISGFNVTNGCGSDGCNGGALNVRTGVVTEAEVRTTPGAYQCFAVQAIGPGGMSSSARMACLSTPGIDIPVTRQWTDTGVTVKSGAYIGISASGEAYVAAAGSSEPPGGDPACGPEQKYPADSARFPASQLPCWSLIARIGDDPPFVVGASTLIPATSGRLYLGVNCPSVAGNSGAWAVKIKIGGPP